MNPYIIIFLGVSITLIGALWASVIANKDTQKINEKNEQIIALTEEINGLSQKAFDQITGGNSWAYIKSGLETMEGIMAQESLWTIVLVGHIPMYDVTLQIFKVRRENGSYGLNPFMTEKIGTVTPSLHSMHIGLINLESDNGRVEFLIRISARNGEIVQNIILIKIQENLWSKAQKVYKFVPNENGGFKKEILLESLDENFPEKTIRFTDF